MFRFAAGGEACVLGRRELTSMTCGSGWKGSWRDLEEEQEWARCDPWRNVYVV